MSDTNWEHPDAVLRIQLLGKRPCCVHCRHFARNLPEGLYDDPPSHCDQYRWSGMPGDRALPNNVPGFVAFIPSEVSVCDLFNDLTPTDDP